MNGKNQCTLADTFSIPIPKNILWSDIEKLLITLGCTVTTGNDSQVMLDYGGVRLPFVLHPLKETKPYAVRIAKEF